jgi:hypothetical protein
MLHKIWIIGFFCCNLAFAQTVTIDLNPSTSTSAVVGQNTYHVGEAIYTDTEIGATNFISSSSPINQLSFQFTQLSSITNFSTYRIWMKNVASTVSGFSSGTYSTSGYTLVFDQTVNINSIGWKTFNLSSGFVRSAGNNLMVLIERLDGVVHGSLPGNASGFVVATSNGNSTSTTILSYRRYNGSSLPTSSTSLAVTAFRPAIRFGYQSPLGLTLRQPIFPDPSCKTNGNMFGWWVLNTGTDTMRSGEWRASMSVLGSNDVRDSALQFQSIAPGDSLAVFFQSVALPNPGNNAIRFTLNWSGNSTTKQDSFARALILNSFPISTGFEVGSTLFTYRKIISGTRDLWIEQSGNYSNPDQALPLMPRIPGSRFMLFDAYGGVNSSGSTSRIFSPCIDLNRWGNAGNRTARLRFWMSHDPLFEWSADSLFVVISADQGASWNRVAGFARVNSFITEPTWSMDSVDLTGYWGQTIQIGFEGKSQFGNAFGLDDVEIFVNPNCLQAPTVFAGNDTAICSGSSYVLSSGLPGFSGPASSIFWRSSGTGSFQGGDLFNQATSYVPSPSDLSQGSVVLKLIGLAADTLQCPSDTATLNLSFLKIHDTTLVSSGCQPLPWQGTMLSESGNYVWNGTNRFGCDSIIRMNFTRFETDSTFSSVSSCQPIDFFGSQLTLTGRYLNTMTNRVGCDSVLILDFIWLSNSFFRDTQYVCAPFVWNGIPITQSGTFSYTTSNVSGCDSIQTLVVIMENCTTRFRFRVFMEGMYRGGSQQATLLSDLGMHATPDATDSLTLQCWSMGGSLIFSTRGIVNQQGWFEAGIPSIHQNKAVYLAILHRNSVAIWSADPVWLSGVDTIELTNSREWIFEDGVNDPLSVLQDGSRAMYGGDLNQDGTVDIFDAQLAENEAAAFGFGYLPGDLNGDGTTDIFDLQLIENNGARFIFSARPF